MSASDIVLGLGITVILAVGCQIVAAKFRLPAIVLLLPAGFIAGHYITRGESRKDAGSGLFTARWAGRGHHLVRWRIGPGFSRARGSQPAGGASPPPPGHPHHVRWGGLARLAISGYFPFGGGHVGRHCHRLRPDGGDAVIGGGPAGAAPLPNPRVGGRHDRPDRRHHRRRGVPRPRAARAAGSWCGAALLSAEYRDRPPRRDYRDRGVVAALEQAPS